MLFFAHGTTYHLEYDIFKPPHRKSQLVNNILNSNLVILSSLFLLTSCANSPRALLRSAVHTAVYSVSDSIRGYRVIYHSIPAGAKVLCGGDVLQGEAPIERHYDLTPDQKANQIFELDNCYALWPSGARVDINPAVPLDVHPSFVHVITLRPTDAPDLNTDIAYGEKTLAARQRLNDDLQRLAGGTVGLMAELYAQNRARKDVAGGVASPSIARQFQGAISSDGGGMRWRLVTAQSGFDSQLKSRPTFTPVFAADRCLGPVVLGECKGSIAATGNIQSYCAGKFVNGECLGSVVFGK